MGLFFNQGVFLFDQCCESTRRLGGALGRVTRHKHFAAVTGMACGLGKTRFDTHGFAKTGLIKGGLARREIDLADRCAEARFAGEGVGHVLVDPSRFFAAAHPADTGDAVDDGAGGRTTEAWIDDDALAAQLWVDPGTGPAQDGQVAFAPSAVLALGVSDDPEERILVVSGWSEIGEVAIGTLAALGGELIRIDGITAEAITVGRGCLDTVPTPHEAGTPIVFFDEAAGISVSQYAAGETLAARLLPETGSGTLAFALAPEDVVTLERRGIRPLPPGRASHRVRRGRRRTRRRCRCAAAARSPSV